MVSFNTNFLEFAMERGVGGTCKKWMNFLRLEIIIRFHHGECVDLIILSDNIAESVRHVGTMNLLTNEDEKIVRELWQKQRNGKSFQ